MTDLDTILRSLIKGKFSSIHISFNDLHACNYMTAKQWADEFPTDKDISSYNNLDQWVSPEERKKALENNSVWSAQWYPDTPVGFCILYASSFNALITALEHIND